MTIPPISPESRAEAFALEAFKTFGVSEARIREYARPIADLIREAENAAYERAAALVAKDYTTVAAKAIRAFKHVDALSQSRPLASPPGLKG